MNRASAIVFLGLGLLASPLVMRTAQSADAAVPRVGVIDLEKTLYETPAGKRASEAFDKTRVAKQAELDKRQKDLQKYSTDLEKQASVLKPEVLATKRGDLEKKFVEVQQLYVKLERDLTGERTKLIQDILAKAEPLIAELAKAENIDVIFDHGAVLFATPAVDLTEKLNAKMK